MADLTLPILTGLVLGMISSPVMRASLRRLHPIRLLGQAAFIAYALALCSAPVIVAHYMRVARFRGFDTENGSLAVVVAWAVPAGLTFILETRRSYREQDERRATGLIVETPVDPSEPEITMTMMLIVQLLIMLGVVAMALRMVWE